MLPLQRARVLLSFMKTLCHVKLLWMVSAVFGYHTRKGIGKLDTEWEGGLF